MSHCSDGWKKIEKALVQHALLHICCPPQTLPCELTDALDVKIQLGHIKYCLAFAVCVDMCVCVCFEFVCVFVFVCASSLAIYWGSATLSLALELCSSPTQPSDSPT